VSTANGAHLVEVTLRIRSLRLPDGFLTRSTPSTRRAAVGNRRAFSTPTCWIQCRKVAIGDSEKTEEERREIHSQTSRISVNHLLQGALTHMA
jgi:hypothetical protein